jgi:hypothetical protein
MNILFKYLPFLPYKRAIYVFTSPSPTSTLELFIFALYLYTKKINPWLLIILSLSIFFLFDHIIIQYLSLLFFLFGLLLILTHLYINYTQFSAHSEDSYVYIIIKFTLLVLIFFIVLALIFLLLKLSTHILNVVIKIFDLNNNSNLKCGSNKGKIPGRPWGFDPKDHIGSPVPGPQNPEPVYYTFLGEEENSRKKRKMDRELDKLVGVTGKRLRDMGSAERINKILEVGNKQKNRIIKSQLNKDCWIDRSSIKTSFKGKRGWTDTIDLNNSVSSNNKSGSDILDKINEEKKAYANQSRKFRNIIYHIDKNRTRREWFPNKSRPLFEKYIVIVDLLLDNLKTMEDNLKNNS